jgi:ribonucleoside-triphosphate reductase
MIKLNKTQLNELDKFVKHYIDSENAASGSLVDANANVTEKNVVTMMGEFTKPIELQMNRYKRYQRLINDFDQETADQYINDLEHHIIYHHDETHYGIPYCQSITLYPFLVSGSKTIGGNTSAPKHFSSYIGGLINLLNQLAAGVAGAVAVPSLLICADYFLRKDYGQNYLETHKETIIQEFQHLVYYLSEPCSGRNSQSVFWNMSIFDKNYLHELYKDFIYPEDFSKVNFESVMKLQKFFLTWFNKEREKALLTFPVITCALQKDQNNNIKDIDFKDYLAQEMSEGNSFFIYLSKNIDSLSMCCRLEVKTTNTFSYTLGNIGEQTGSISVITINMNRLTQDIKRKYDLNNITSNFLNYLQKELKKVIERVHKYHISTRKLIMEFHDAKMYPAYNAGYISIDKQYSTLGINGLLEAAEFLGYDITPNDEYMNFLSLVLRTFKEMNEKAKEKYDCLWNSEVVPAENLGVKNAQWDKADGYFVPRDCYNSYFYKVEDNSLSIIDKAKLHSENISRHCDGGSAVHYNLEEYLDKEQYLKFIDMNAILGIPYFTYNVMITCCEENDCGFIDKRTLHHCSKCGSKNISHATRIIGYLRKIKNFALARQNEAKLRFYHKN